LSDPSTGTRMVLIISRSALGCSVDGRASAHLARRACDTGRVRSLRPRASPPTCDRAARAVRVQLRGDDGQTTRRGRAISGLRSARPQASLLMPGTPSRLSTTPKADAPMHMN
jgi:hypothetical protein